MLGLIQAGAFVFFADAQAHQGIHNFCDNKRHHGGKNPGSCYGPKLVQQLSRIAV